MEKQHDPFCIEGMIRGLTSIYFQALALPWQAKFVISICSMLPAGGVR